MTDQPPPNTDLTDVERLYPAALKRLAEQTELIVELETKLAAMQQPVHADEVAEALSYGTLSMGKSMVSIDFETRERAEQMYELLKARTALNPPTIPEKDEQ